MGERMDRPFLVAQARNHSLSALLVHAVWATADRTPALLATTDALLEAVLRRKANELRCALLAAGNAADHVHVLVQHPPALSVAELLRCLKGASSHEAHRAGWMPIGVRWQVGYWAESVGSSQLSPLQRYVQGQREHHEQGDSWEPWEQMLDSVP